MAKRKNRIKNKNFTNFIVLLIITILDFFIPDPLPIIDEIILLSLTVWLGSKNLQGGKNG